MIRKLLTTLITPVLSTEPYSPEITSLLSQVDSLTSLLDKNLCPELWEEQAASDEPLGEEKQRTYEMCEKWNEEIY